MSSDPGSLERWLDAHGLAHYAEALRGEGIDLDVLTELSPDDLRELGVSMGDRKRFARAIAGRKAGEEPPAVAAPDPGAGTPGPAERRRMTILFCDVVGSTRLAGLLDPEELGATMRAFQKACIDVVARWDGHVSKFLGDGAVVFFGWPRAHEHDAERAVRAGLDLVEAIGRIRAGGEGRLQARVGIATGLVMVGDVLSDAQSRREDVVGETPNLAARLQGEAPPGGVVIAPETRRLVGHRFRLTSLGSRSLKGVHELVEVWLVAGVDESASRFGASHVGGSSPMVGRDAQRDLLVEAWRESAAGRGRFVLVRGEPGIGKSRLLQALADDQAARDAHPIRLQCSPYHTSTPLQPFAEWLRSAAGLTAAGTPSERLALLAGFVEGLDLEAGESVALLAGPLAIPLEGSAHRPLALGPQRQRERTIDLWARIVTALTGRAPTLLAVEDLHWADPTTLEVLARIIDDAAAHRLLVVGTARPEFDPTFGAPEATHIELQRLDAETITEMIRRLTGGTEPPESVLRFIHRSADGTPLFVEEVTRALSEAGRLDDSAEVAVDPVPFDDTVPATLHDLLASRLDGLERGRDVARVAAVVGRSFSREILAHLLPDRSDALARDLDYLCQAGILDLKPDVGPEAEYSFRHALVRDAAYQSQLRSDRRVAHRRVAAVLETHGGDLAETEPELLAHHHARGGQPLQASNYLLRAGQRALQVGATREAISQLSRGCRLLEDLPSGEERDRVEMRLQAALGTGYMLARSWAADEVADAYQRAASLSDAAETTSERIWVLWGAWVHHQVRGRLNDAWKASRAIEAFARTSDIDEDRVVAGMISLQAHTYTGRFAGARRACEEFLEIYDRDRHGHLTAPYSTDLDLVRCVHHAIVEWILGDYARARDLVDEAARRSATISHAYSSAWAPTWSALVPLLSGDFERVAALTAQGAAVAHSNDYPYVIALGRLLEGAARGLAGAPDEGIREIDRALDEFHATGAEIVYPLFKTLKAELLLMTGRADDTLEVLAEAESQILAWGERWQASEVHRVRARALAHGGAPANGVEAAHRTAVAVARAQEAPSWELRAVTDLAEWLGGIGRGGEAHGELAGLVDALPDPEATADTRRARDVLAELRP